MADAARVMQSIAQQIARLAELQAIPAARRTLANRIELDRLRNRTLRLGDLVALDLLKEPA
jgi:hypothetical protein